MWEISISKISTKLISSRFDLQINGYYNSCINLGSDVKQKLTYIVDWVYCTYLWFIIRLIFFVQSWRMAFTSCKMLSNYFLSNFWLNLPVLTSHLLWLNSFFLFILNQYSFGLILLVLCLLVGPLLGKLIRRFDFSKFSESCRVIKSLQGFIF